MRLSFAVLGLLGAGLGVGCDANPDAPTDGYAYAPATAEPEAFDAYGAPVKAPDPRAAESTPPDAIPTPPETVARREPPTPPPHVNELFRTPGGSVASPSSPDPGPAPSPTPAQTTKPVPPPPPPRPGPRPWGGNDPCPPCGMG